MPRFQDEFAREMQETEDWFTYIAGEERIFPDPLWQYALPRGDGYIPHDITGYSFSATARFFDSVQVQMGLDGSMNIKRIVPSTTRQETSLTVVTNDSEGQVAVVFPPDIWTGDVPFNTDRPPAIGVWLYATPTPEDRSFPNQPETWTERFLVVVRS